MHDELAHECGMAEHALMSITANILILALDPKTRDKLDTKEISQAIERLQDALVLKTRELAA